MYEQKYIGQTYKDLEKRRKKGNIENQEWSENYMQVESKEIQPPLHRYEKSSCGCFCTVIYVLYKESLETLKGVR